MPSPCGSRAARRRGPFLDLVNAVQRETVLSSGQEDRSLDPVRGAGGLASPGATP